MTTPSTKETESKEWPVMVVMDTMMMTNAMVMANAMVMMVDTMMMVMTYTVMVRSVMMMMDTGPVPVPAGSATASPRHFLKNCFI